MRRASTRPAAARASAAGPILFVTGHAPAYRVGALARLHEQEGIDLALFGGRSAHGGPGFEGTMPFPHRHVPPRRLGALAASGDYRAVVCPTGGRLAPLASWSGARRARVPLILWASLWAHPHSLPHAFTYLPLRRLYRSADGVVTYGPHVSAYVRARGARNVHVAPQAVDNEFWSSSEVAAPRERAWPSDAEVRFLFVGRPEREKGLDVLARAWRATELAPQRAALVLAGVEQNLAALAPDGPRRRGDAGIVGLGRLDRVELRNVYAAADVLVLPSIATRTFREPWGLVINEAMNRGLPVIASDAVGAAAGGLVRNEANGLVVPAGDSDALGQAILRLAEDRQLRERLGAQAARDVRSYDYEAWAAGFSAALDQLNLSRGRC
ncbi:MAG TPA: glycosyltransferase family 4 protein [Solirubrobacteraceae bacterium]|nr:glycosyltransferase family 4 protein [Solirubrobacteraceae bacterium]